MIETISMLIGVGSSLLSVKDKLFNSKRHLEIAQWLYDLGSTIESVAISFSNSEYPSQSCARMEYIYNHLDDMIKNTISKEEKEDLQKLLGSCLNTEKMYGDYLKLEEPDRVNCVQELYSISGTILGIADTIKFQR